MIDTIRFIRKINKDIDDRVKKYGSKVWPVEEMESFNRDLEELNKRFLFKRVISPFLKIFLKNVYFFENRRQK